MTRRKFSYDYARKALMVDAVVLGLTNDRLQTLLVRRKIDPFKGWWALPGGHVEIQETLEQAVHRELVEETSVRDLYLEQFHAFSAVDRDPREPTVSVAYYALVRPGDVQVKAGSDAKEAKWFDVEGQPRLAFDHAEVLNMGVDRMRKNLADRPGILRGLLGHRFTLAQLHTVYQQLMGETLDSSNLRRDLLRRGVIEEVGKAPTEVTRRPIMFYRFQPV